MTTPARLTSLVCLLVAAACAGPNPDKSPATPVSTPPADAATVEDAPPKKPASPKPASTAKAPEDLEIPVDDDPKQFLTQASETVAVALGKPTLIRRDGPAQVWQYKGQGCILDVYMYVQEPLGFIVRHVELRGAGLPQKQRRDCLAAMLRAKAVKTS